jgi:cysteinyl-tRNA synthetase
MEAYEWLKELAVERWQLADRPAQSVVNGQPMLENELNQKILKLINEFDEFINDDFNTAKVLANIFEIVPIINSLKDKSIGVKAISSDTIKLMQQKMKLYLEDILGLKNESLSETNKLKGVVQVLINLRKEAREKKDWMTSDKIRNQLAEVGVLLKDEKNGEMSWSVSER